MKVQSDPDLVTPDIVTPRFSDMINIPRYKKLMAFDPDLVTPRFSDRKSFPPRMSLNRGPTVQAMRNRTINSELLNVSPILGKQIKWQMPNNSHRNRPKQEMLVPDWLITSHVT